MSRQNFVPCVTKFGMGFRHHPPRKADLLCVLKRIRDHYFTDCDLLRWNEVSYELLEDILHQQDIYTVGIQSYGEGRYDDWKSESKEPDDRTGLRGTKRSIFRGIVNIACSVCLPGW